MKLLPANVDADQAKVEVKVEIEMAISSHTQGSDSTADASIQRPQRLRATDTTERPGRVAADQRLGVSQQADQGWHECRVAGIARGDTRVAHQAAALGAQHRCPAKPGAKAGVVQGQQFGQRDSSLIWRRHDRAGLNPLRMTA